MSERFNVAIDVDGVLADISAGWRGPDHIGDPLPGAVEFTRAVAEFADIIIYTCRLNPLGVDAMTPEGWPDHLHTVSQRRDFLAAWLDRHGIVYHRIWTEQGKPWSVAYVDDRAVTCQPHNRVDAFLTTLGQIQELLGAKTTPRGREALPVHAVEQAIRPIEEALSLILQGREKRQAIGANPELWQVEQDLSQAWQALTRVRLVLQRHLDRAKQESRP